jgi:hypothetical protein
MSIADHGSGDPEKWRRGMTGWAGFVRRLLAVGSRRETLMLRSTSNTTTGFKNRNSKPCGKDEKERFQNDSWNIGINIQWQVTTLTTRQFENKFLPTKREQCKHAFEGTNKPQAGMICGRCLVEKNHQTSHRFYGIILQRPSEWFWVYLNGTNPGGSAVYGYKPDLHYFLCDDRCQLSTRAVQNTFCFRWEAIISWEKAKRRWIIIF